MCTLPKRECVTLKSALNHVICILTTGLGDAFFFSWIWLHEKLDGWMDGWMWLIDK